MSEIAEFLNPDVLRSRLVAASLYIAAFELLEDTIVNRIRDFYLASPEFKGSFLPYETHFRDYESEVLSKDPKNKKDPVRGSLAWLNESNAISNDDLGAFQVLKRIRDEIVHELARKVFDGLATDFTARFVEIISLLEKIEKWWIKNVEIATNPGLRGNEIDESAIIPGSVMVLHLMIDVALGPEEVAKRHFDEFVRQIRPTRLQ